MKFQKVISITIIITIIINPGLTRTFFPTNSLLAIFNFFFFIFFIFFFYSSSYYLFIYSFIFFILEISVIRSAEYKLPITREICICMFSLYIKMKF